MLELRPNCECCDKDLLPESPEAMICTYECTFCATCVENVLHNVCPNCGGGFQKRPVRPTTARRHGVSLAHQAASTKRRQLKYKMDEVKQFAEAHKSIAPENR